MSDFTSRHALFGSIAFQFKGTTNTIPSPRQSSDFQFTIDFIDACRASNIVPKVISISVKYDVSQSQNVPAFTDTVDATGSYTAGICGELRITLGLTGPAFLTITPDPTDPEKNDFIVSYDPTRAVEGDIKTHSIAYTVTSIQYPGLVSDLPGTLSFTIQYPDNSCSMSAYQIDELQNVLNAKPIKLTS